MPEGPIITLLKEEAQIFTGEVIQKAEGSAMGTDLPALEGQKIIAFKSWGKHLLICLPDFTIRVHLMLFGSWLINSRKASAPKLSLQFKNGEINFYACAVTKIDAPLDQVYDWSEDIMSNKWDAQKAIQKLKQHPGMMVCDALLDQHIFSGSGNIIKNEVLFRTHIHPESLVGKLSLSRLKELVKETVHYGRQFYNWRKDLVLKEHWLVYTKKLCPRDHTRIVKSKPGKSRRTTYYCPTCQKLYQ